MVKHHSRPKIAIIGTGNVAGALASMLKDCDVELTIYGRDRQKLQSISEHLQIAHGYPIASIDASTDIAIISVSDDAVADLSPTLPPIKGIYVHTSGSVSIEALNMHKKYGVFYPLQTFNKSSQFSLHEITMLIEGNDPSTENSLLDLASSIGLKSLRADSKMRSEIHLAAVFACNFTNYLLQIADRRLGQSGLSLDILKPLVERTIQNVFASSPFASLTGPARRGDVSIIENHLSRLENEDASIYRSISSSILKLYHNSDYHAMSRINYDLRKIKAFVFDVDGVLSPSTIPLGADGVPNRMVNIKDGYAMQLAVKKGYRLAIITGAVSDAIAVRYNALGIRDVFQGASKKLPILTQWIEQNGLIPEEIAYVGDDIPDIEVMRHVGLAVCPSDGDVAVKEISTYISPVVGGYGVARDLIEQVMRAKDDWMSDTHAFGW